MENSDRRPLIISHRGASALAPENTFAAFSLALKSGTEGIEFDVRLTRDGVPVVFHDADLKRIAGSEESVSSLTASQLDEIDAGSWFNINNPEHADGRFVGEKIPTLEATMELLKDFTGKIYVELKSAGRDVRLLAKTVGEVLSNHPANANVIVKCFNFAAIPIVLEHCPGVESAALFAPKIMLILQNESRLVSAARELGANRLSIHSSLATRNLMKMAKEAGLPVTIWTVDSPLWLRKSIELGIDSIITNDPARMLAIRGHSE